MSLHPVLPDLVSEIAMRSTPAMEHMDLRCRTGSFTVTAVTGQWGKARARHSTPFYSNIIIQKDSDIYTVVVIRGKVNDK